MIDPVKTGEAMKIILQKLKEINEKEEVKDNELQKQRRSSGKSSGTL